jgi:low affinity Fe/Cu permease
MKSFSNRFSYTVTKLSGKPAALAIAFLVIILCAMSGVLFDFSDSWKLAIIMGTTVITFLMVFIIQQSHNKDIMALQLKLNELIACREDASNRLIDIEALSNEELEVLKQFYARLSMLSRRENNLHTSHSPDEAAFRHQSKRRAAKKPFPHVL